MQRLLAAQNQVESGAAANVRAGRAQVQQKRGVGAAAGAIVTGMIVRTGKRHDGVEQACFLEAKKNGIGAQFGAETAFTKLVVRLAGIIFAIGITNFAFLAASASLKRGPLEAVVAMNVAIADPLSNEIG